MERPAPNVVDFRKYIFLPFKLRNQNVSYCRWYDIVYTKKLAGFFLVVNKMMVSLVIVSILDETGYIKVLSDGLMLQDSKWDLMFEE